MTVEEKAREYTLSCVCRSDHQYDKRSSFEGYLSGYDEAMRWKDPKEEPPTAGESVIVKYRTAKGKEKYGIGKYFDLGIGNPWTIEGSTGREVIGWRPIE